MLREALELIQQTAVNAAGAHKMFASRDGRTATFWEDGKAVEHDLGVSPRDHEVETLSDLVRFIASRTTPGFSIWHNSDGVVLLCDDAERLDRVTFSLNRSEPLLAVQRMTDDSRFSQAEFVRLLHRTLQVPAPIVAAFRKLDFKVVQASEGEIQHGKDRMGRTVQAEVQGTGELPEEILVSIPLYTNVGEQEPYTLVLSIDLDAQRSQIVCQPQPGELDHALDTHQAGIRKRLADDLGLEEETARIYHGAP